MLEELRLKAVELQTKDEKKYKLISDILSNEDCFNNMNIEEAYSILNDLEVEDIQKTYIKLMKRK